MSRVGASSRVRLPWVHTQRLLNGTEIGGFGWVEEVPGVNGQERSREELLASLRIILAEALEFNRQEARAAAESGFEEETLSI